MLMLVSHNILHYLLIGFNWLKIYIYISTQINHRLNIKTKLLIKHFIKVPHFQIKLEKDHIKFYLSNIEINWLRK